MKQSSLRRLDERPGPNGEVFLWPSSANTTGRLEAKLLSAGLLATKPRIALCGLLFTKRDRHVTAEMLFEEAKQSKISVSLATVYNTLRQFIQAGLLRPLAGSVASNSTAVIRQADPAGCQRFGRAHRPARPVDRRR